MEEERQLCTKDNVSDGTPYKWTHPDAELIRSHGAWEEGESYDEYRCPHCNIWFKVYSSK